MKRIIFAVVCILAVAVVGVGSVSAQINTSAQNTSTTSCVSLTYDLTKDSKDSKTGNQVTLLQRFLISKGYLNAKLAPGSAVFSSGTLVAVQKFQKDSGITPANG